MIDNHIMPVLGDKPIDAIRKMDIEALVAGWAAKGLAKATGRFLLCQTRSILEEACNNELIARNPSRGVRLPLSMAGRTPTRPYTLAEVRTMLALVGGVDGIMLRILLLTGVRPGEMLALRVGALKDNFLIVEESTDSAKTVKDTKTHRRRDVAVSPRLLRDLRAYLVGCSDKQALMFPGGRHKYWTVGGWYQHIQGLLAGAIPGFTLRRCRATCATQLDADTADVQAILGHTTPDVTLEHYRRGLPERQSAAVARLEGEMIQ